MKIGLYFGTFDPIHLGHISIANFLINNKLLNEVWFIVTPQNPEKNISDLTDFTHRFEIVKIQIKDNNNLKASDIELNLEKPNYTINSLKHISNKFPNDIFSIIIGEDNLINFKNWKGYKEILNCYKIYVYPRTTKRNKSVSIIKHSNIQIIKAPLVEINSTNIRQLIKERGDVIKFISNNVYKYITKHNLYI
tara:strand:- start:5287 stop:5865 length:579 start_codon:yes stop_codon:yes gene_type:complete